MKKKKKKNNAILYYTTLHYAILRIRLLRTLLGVFYLNILVTTISAGLVSRDVITNTLNSNFSDSRHNWTKYSPNEVIVHKRRTEIFVFVNFKGSQVAGVVMNADCMWWGWFKYSRSIFKDRTHTQHDKVTDVGRYSGCVNANKILIMSEKHYDLK